MEQLVDELVQSVQQMVSPVHQACPPLDSVGLIQKITVLGLKNITENDIKITLEYHDNPW